MVKPVPITPQDIRQARAYLQKRDLHTSDVSPKDFASLSKKMDKTFAETLKYLATLQLGGQGRGQSAETEDAIAQEKQ